jgi:hypothetical protein
MKNSIRGFLPVLYLIVTGSFIVSCGGSTTTGGKEDISGSQFVSTEDSTGTLSVQLEDNTIEVGQTSSFVATVNGVEGQAVDGLRVFCDSDSGLALVEPTTGSSLTNSSGSISGVIGCERPGSFILGCFSSNQRKFASVRCVGNVPTGFEGFEGAGGGNLGGGVVDPDNGGPGLGDDLAPNRLRLANIQIVPITGVADSVPEVDLVRDTCNNDTPDDRSDDFVEPFGDDEISLTVVNDTPYFIRFTHFRYQVQRGLSGGRDYVSPLLSINGASDPTNEEGRTVTVLSKIFASVVVGGTARKGYADGQPIPLGGSDNGDDLKNVKITVYGTTSTGIDVETSASLVVSLDNFNYCVGQN